MTRLNPTVEEVQAVLESKGPMLSTMLAEVMEISHSQVWRALDAGIKTRVLKSASFHAKQRPRIVVYAVRGTELSLMAQVAEAAPQKPSEQVYVAPKKSKW